MDPFYRVDPLFLLPHFFKNKVDICTTTYDQNAEKNNNGHIYGERSASIGRACEVRSLRYADPLYRVYSLCFPHLKKKNDVDILHTQIK